VVVSRKVSKSAVVRNRIRRRIYECVRNFEPLAVYDLVFIVYDEQVATMPAVELGRIVKQNLRKSGCLQVEARKSAAGTDHGIVEAKE
jgi:ribonuclease P protein component